MKKTLLFLLPFLMLSLTASAQGLPSVIVKNLLGENINVNTIENGEYPIVLSFWATWCKPCIKELNTIQDMYEDWQDDTGVKIIAISIDDARNASLVAPFVNGRAWPYDVFIDENSDLKRAMNVVNIPHVFLLDKDKQVVWQHTSYAPGDEEELYDQILELVGEGK
ncbi:MAG: TlpA disulfide reductase family protein [Bacteroidota bacterium]